MTPAHIHVQCTYQEYMYEGHKKQEAQGPWHSAWCIVWWNRNSIMDNGNVDEVTYCQLVPSVFNIWQMAEQVIHLYPLFPPDFCTVCKVWLKLDENRGNSSLLKILTSEFVNCTEWPQTDLKGSDRKVPNIHSSYHRESQSFVHFALRLAILKIFHIIEFSHSLLC